MTVPITPGPDGGGFITDPFTKSGPDGGGFITRAVYTDAEGCGGGGNPTYDFGKLDNDKVPVGNGTTISAWIMSSDRRGGSVTNQAVTGGCSSNLRSVKAHSSKRYFEMFVDLLPLTGGAPEIRMGAQLTVHNSGVGTGSPGLPLGTNPVQQAQSWGYSNLGNLLRIPGTTQHPPVYVQGDVVMFAIDGVAGNVWVGKGGVWFNSGDPANGINPSIPAQYYGSFYACIGSSSSNNIAGTQTMQATGRFTRADCSFAPPVGFLCWDD